jgi:hypothetical protein
VGVIVEQAGKRVFDRELKGGADSYRWDAAKFASGIYSARLYINNRCFAKKLILMK